MPEDSLVELHCAKSDASLNFPVEIEVQNRGNLKAGIMQQFSKRIMVPKTQNNMLTVPARSIQTGKFWDKFL